MLRTMRRFAVRGVLILAVALGIVGCAGQIESTVFGSIGTQLPAPSGEPAFDLATVRDNLAADCETPTIANEVFCPHVATEGLEADGSTLVVPTDFSADDGDLATVTCDYLAQTRFDVPVGEDPGGVPGYVTIQVLGQDGAVLHACAATD